MNFQDLPKAYEAKEVEDKIYKRWEESGYFNPEKLPERNQKGEPYCIVFPPPNRTGNMHLGHAKTVAIEDILIRHYRMRGHKTYWIPGTDHAAISTQVKVEQLLIKEGIKDPRKELGREEFLKRVRDFAQGSRDNIVSQCKAMGGSMDWNREKYTLDDERNKAVNAVFKMMYDDGLIERGYRIVNWDPVFQTTLSDDEVLHKETTAEFITFTYDKNFPIAISTTRPETKFGDTAVAVNPDDDRYKQFIGQELMANFCGKSIKVKVIADKEVDPNFGTGALGVTPAHSMIDAEMAERHGLNTIPVIGSDACMLPEAGPEFAGLTISETRSKCISILKEQGCLIKQETIPQNLMVAERGGNPVEQLPMMQWFIRVNKPYKVRQNTLGKWKIGDEATLKELMRYAVESGQIKIHPESQKKVYYGWVDNLRDWCISRQIWFGHQIPVWYHLNSDFLEIYKQNPEEHKNFLSDSIEFVVSDANPENPNDPTGEKNEHWVRDPDSLDTWFSSGLWTFSTIGWPDSASVDADGNLVKTGELKEYHPTSVLETGRDIIFFWVARMILMTTYALGEVPFKDTYLHGLVLDEHGRKMSKSLGNTIEPMEMIPKYGTDAVRLALTLGTSPGLDQKLSEEKIKDFRNFTNKLWNISRFILTNIEPGTLNMDPSEIQVLSSKFQVQTLADKWIIKRLNEVVVSVTNKLESYQFSPAGEELRDFTWNDLADWYLEIAKIEGNKSEILIHILQTILKLWHPFMPFVTEHIWSQFNEDQLIVAEWPTEIPPNLPLTREEPDNSPLVKGGLGDWGVNEFETLRALITDLRRLRSEQNVEPAKKVDFAIVADQGQRQLIKENLEVIKSLTRAEKIDLATAIPEGWATDVSGTMSIGLNLAGAIDVETEKAKLQKEIDELTPYIASTSAKLENSDFTSKAPAHVVQSMKDKLDEAKKKRESLEERLKLL